jgi:hypothetical protein
VRGASNRRSCEALSVRFRARGFEQEVDSDSDDDDACHGDDDAVMIP